MKDRQESSAPSPSLWRVLTSVVASMFGVQSSRNREQDFTSGSPLPYIVVGLLVTVGFILTVWLVVRAVLHSANL